MNGLDPHRFCLMVLKYYSPEAGGYQNLPREIQAFEWATSHHAVLINFSGGGPDGPIFAEAQAVFAALQAGIIVVVAAGNEGKDIGKPKQGYYPACSVKHQNFHVVGSGLDVNRRAKYSNYGMPVTDWAPGDNIKSPKGQVFSGTSQATALVSHRILQEAQ
jgi:subtilisin family serine protease